MINVIDIIMFYNNNIFDNLKKIKKIIKNFYDKIFLVFKSSINHYYF